MSNRIITQKGRIGPYTFWSTLPRIRSSEDVEQWHFAISDREDGRSFPSLEDAMRAAVTPREGERG